MYLYIRTTDDEYELPMMVCTSATELARKAGVSESAIYNAIFRTKKNPDYKTTFHRIEIEDET